MPQTDLFTRLAPYGSDSGATFSPCQRYRYHLWRSWADRENRVAFIGLNPSTADDTVDDPTIRKCIGFAKRWGFGALDMLNLFAWRNTEPRGLKETSDPVGPRNDDTIRRVAGGAKRVVFAWGSHAPVRDLITARLDSWRLDRDLGCFIFGRNADGQPKHPLMLAYSTKLEALR